MFNAVKNLFGTAAINKLRDWWDFPDYSDVTLIVTFNFDEKVEYKLHRIFLACSGEYLKELMYGADKKETYERFYTGKNSRKLFEICLKFIYRKLEWKDLESNTAELLELQHISKNLGLLILSNIIDCVLPCDVLKDNIFECLYISMKTKNECNKTSCLKFISATEENLFEDEKFLELEPDMFLEIIKIPKWCMAEIEVFKAIVKFAEKAVPNKLCRISGPRDVLSQSQIPAFCNSQRVEIEKIFEASNNPQYGTLLYSRKISDDRLIHIRNFLLSTNLMSSFRVLTMNLTELIFDITLTSLFIGDEILFICNFLKSQQVNLQESPSPLICSNTECRGLSQNADCKRKAVIQTSIKLITSFELDTEYRFKYEEQFTYTYDIPMIINYIIFYANVCHLGTYQVQLFINDSLKNKHSYCTKYGDRLVKACLVYNKICFVKKGDVINIIFSFTDTHQGIYHRLVHKPCVRQILTYRESKSMTCIHTIGIDFYV